jgi:heme exporter protein B
MEAGVVDQLHLRGITEPVVAAAKMLAHWIAFAPPLMLATVIVSALLDLSAETLVRLEIGLLLGTPGLAALAVATAALTAGLRGGGGVAGLVMLPLALPLLIFGVGANEPAALKLIAAVSLLLIAGAPFVAGAAMRTARD